MVHETAWLPKGTGTPSAKGRFPSFEWFESFGGGATNWCVSLFGSSMAADTSGRWRDRTGSEARTRPPSETPSRSMSSAIRYSAAGSSCLGVPERHLDTEADCTRDSEGVPGPLRRWSRMEASASVGLELPSSGEKSNPTRRRGNRELEAVQVACAKKNGKDLGPTSPSSMKAASCSFRVVAGPGESPVRRRSFATTIVTTVSPLLLRSPYRDATSGSASTYAFSQPISRHATRLNSCAFSCGTFEDTSSLYGTTAAFTGGRSSERFKRSSRAFSLYTFPATLQSSTQWSRSGTTSSDTQPTRSFYTKRISNAVFIKALAGCGKPRLCFAPLCALPIYHGLLKPSFHYLCETL